MSRIVRYLQSVEFGRIVSIRRIVGIVLLVMIMPPVRVVAGAARMSWS
jgi:hypothetical protein